MSMYIGGHGRLLQPRRGGERATDPQNHPVRPSQHPGELLVTFLAPQNPFHSLKGI